MTIKQAILFGFVGFILIFLVMYFINRVIGITVREPKVYEDKC